MCGVYGSTPDAHAISRSRFASERIRDFYCTTTVSEIELHTSIPMIHATFPIPVGGARTASPEAAPPARAPDGAETKIFFISFILRPPRRRRRELAVEVAHHAAVKRQDRTGGPGRRGIWERGGYLFCD